MARALTVAISALVLGIAACSSSGDVDSGSPTTSSTDSSTPAVDPAPSLTHSAPGVLGPPTSEAIALESADGAVSLEVPAGAVREGTDVGIDVIAPGEVDGLDGNPTVGSSYRLRPTDLVLAEPLIVTVELPTVEGEAGGQAVPLVVAVVGHGGRLTAALEGRTEVGDDGGTVHRATIDRFGDLVLVDVGVTFELSVNDAAVPVTSRPIALLPGESFESTVSAQPTRDATPGPFDLRVRWSAAGTLSAESAGGDELIEGLQIDGSDLVEISTVRLTCDVVGSGSYRGEVRVDTPGPPGGIASVQFIELVGEASCGDVGR